MRKGFAWLMCLMEVGDEEKIKFIIGYGISHDDGYGDWSDGVCRC